MPYFAMAATVSPPPAMEKAPLEAIARAMPSVPFENASNSKTPTGPFQTMVPASFNWAANWWVVSGPMSRIRSSSSISLAYLVVAGASAEKVLAVTTSVGIGTSAPRARMASITALASGSRSRSARLLPMLIPAASMKVLAMPPPTISWSTLLASALRMVSLVDTLLPATIATKGLRGWVSAFEIASISAASNGPAQAILAYWAMP